MKSCVYKIINLLNNDFYIGSTVNIDERIRNHLRALNKNKHHNKYLQNSWNKYGKNNFIFHIIEYCNKNELKKLEQIYLDNLKPKYNISKDSSAPMRNLKHSEETLNKFRGKPAWNKGIKRTEQEKEYISFRIREELNKKGPEYKQELRDKAKKMGLGYFFKGKSHTPSSKSKLRNANKSKKNIIIVETGEVFEAQLDLARKYNIKQGHVSEILSGIRAQIPDLTIKYVNEAVAKHKTTFVNVKDSNGKEFRTITEFCKFYNLNRTKVLNLFRNKESIEINGIKVYRIKNE